MGAPKPDQRAWQRLKIAHLIRDAEYQTLASLAEATGWPRREITQHLRKMIRGCEVRKQVHLDPESKAQETRYVRWN